MQRRYINKKASNFGAFFKRNLVFIVILILLAIYLVPLVVTRIQDFIAKMKENQNDNETKLIVNTKKNDVIKNSTQNSNSSAVDLEGKFLEIKKKFKNNNINTKLWQSLRSDAENLAFALGTHASNNRAWFGWDGVLEDRPDLNSWTEDEKEAVRILKKYPNTFPIIAEIYYKMFTRSRNLKSDLNQYLEKGHLTYLRKYYLNYKKSWL